MIDISIYTYIFMILIFSTALSDFGARFHVPKIVSQVLTGLIISFIFAKFSIGVSGGYEDVLKLFSEIGLVFLMYIAGLHLQSVSYVFNKKIIFWTILGATLPSLVIGFVFIGDGLISEGQNLPFYILIAIACAVTSIPVISWIFLDFGYIKTSLAGVSIRSAAYQDVFLWGLLSIVIDLKNNSVDNLLFFLPALSTILFVIFMRFYAPRFLMLVYQRFYKYFQANLLAYSICLVFLAVALSDYLHVNRAFAALLIGVLVGELAEGAVKEVNLIIEQIGLHLFAPIYFVFVGVLLFNSFNMFDLLLTIKFLFYSSIVKILGVFLFTYCFLKNKYECLDLAVVMNTRGGPGIMLATIAFSAELIDGLIFSALVFTSIFTSLFTGLWLSLRKKDWNDFKEDKGSLYYRS
jgi:Kef-type K+ transport system membrane component KefB